MNEVRLHYSGEAGEAAELVVRLPNGEVFQATTPDYLCSWKASNEELFYTAAGDPFNMLAIWQETSVRLIGQCKFPVMFLMDVLASALEEAYERFDEDGQGV